MSKVLQRATTIFALIVAGSDAKMYVIGGWGDGKARGVSYEYDPATFAYSIAAVVITMLLLCHYWIKSPLRTF
jgi:hypothetical protein